MKLNCIIFSALCLALATSSCKKEIYGCTDSTAENFSNIATKDDGSCYHLEPTTQSTIVTISNWTAQGTNYVTIIPYGEITSEVIESGAIMVYMESGTNIWKTLPSITYSSGTYHTSMQVSITVGQVIVSVSNSDLSQTTEPSSTTFKISVVS